MESLNLTQINILTIEDHHMQGFRVLSVYKEALMKTDKLSCFNFY